LARQEEKENESSDKSVSNYAPIEDVLNLSSEEGKLQEEELRNIGHQMIRFCFYG